MNPSKNLLKLLLASICALVAPSAARAATVLWPVTDAHLQILYPAPVQVTPLGIYTNGQGGFATKDPIGYTTDTNGLATLSNLTTGTFTAEVTGYGKTKITFTVTNYVGTYFITALSTVPTNFAGIVAYSTVASDGKYLQPANFHAGNNMTIATNGLDLTFNSTSSGPGGGTNFQSLFTGQQVNSNNFIGSNITAFTGTFSNGITANVTGNLTGTAGSFTGTLTGDVTGTQGATVN
jgi:hypothetical protein